MPSAWHPSVAAAIRPWWRWPASLRLEDEHAAAASGSTNQVNRLPCIKPEEALLHLRDIDSGKVVLAHGGSVYWNAYRSAG